MKRVSRKVLSVILVIVSVLSCAVTGLAAYDYPLLDLVFTSAETLYEETEGWAGQKLVGTVTVDIQGSASDFSMRSFSGCDNLTSFEINVEDFESNLKMYGASHCDNLTSVIIKSNGNVNIADGAFRGCDALENLIFDIKGTLTIEEEAFQNCSNLAQVDFSNVSNLVLYRIGCFFNTGLKEVNLLSNTTFAPHLDYEGYPTECEYFFGNCEKLEKFSANCKEIPACTFAGCSNIKKAYLTQNVEKIGYFGFGMDFDNHLPFEGFVTYGYTNSATEEYCNKNGIKFIPVDSAEFNTITSSQSAVGTVGTPSAVTLSVAGYPETIKLESSLCSEAIFTREDAEIVTSETGELWTVDLTPMSEADTYTVTADYGLADLCATDEITIFAEEDTTPPVISVETATPAVLGEYAKVNVTVKNSPEAIRFVDDNVTTIARENAVITENDDNTETWEVNLLVTGNEQQLTVFAKDETGWLTQGTDFTLKAKVIDYSTEISDFAFEESLDGVIYNGMNKITLTTANGISKVQFMKNGNTWTYTEDTAEVIEVDGKKHWTIKMNFWALGDQTYDIRVRTPKTTFEVTDTLNVTVYSR